MAILNVSTTTEEALLVEPACACDEPETCEHADHWRAVEASVSQDWYCDDCVYSWWTISGEWHTEFLCRACGKEEYELWQAGL